MTDGAAPRVEAMAVGNTTAFLTSTLARRITGTAVHVDKGCHAMAVPANISSIVALVDEGLASRAT